MFATRMVSYQTIGNPKRIITILAICLFFTRTTIAASNLIENPGFETGAISEWWYAFGGSSISYSTAEQPYHGGNRSAYVSSREEPWHGIAQSRSLMSKLVPNRIYQISAWMELDAGGGQAQAAIKATIKKTYSDDSTDYDVVASATGTTEYFVQLNNPSYRYIVDTSKTLTRVELYFEGPPKGMNFFLDDVNVIDTQEAGLIGIEIEGPPQVDENSGYQYTCYANYGDGTRINVTNLAQWSENNVYTTISSTGFLTTLLINSQQTVTITARYSDLITTKSVTIIDLPHTVVGIEIAGPWQVNENSSAQYTCTANYADHSTQNVTNSAAWSEDSPYASIDNTGFLTTLAVPDNQFFTISAMSGSFYDDFDVIIADELEPVDWRADANTRIEQNRKRDAEVVVIGLTQQPIPGVSVQIRQKKHRFGFGSAINNAWAGGIRNMSNPDYTNFFKNHFEWAVCENEAKWYANEPVQGYVTYTDADIIYNWCKANGIKMRGHNIFWEVPGSSPSWVSGLSYAPLPAASPLRTAVQSRMNSAVNHFRGKYLHWDVDNEMLSGRFFRDRLGEAIIPWMFRTANQLDPACKLFVNEYSGNSFGGYNSWPYVFMIEDLLAKGAPIHGIGIQGHVPANFDAGRYYDYVLKPLEELGLPIWVTEADVTVADQQNPDRNQQANDLEDLYRIAFSHEKVEGILLWGFWERSHWRPNWWLANADWTLNEAGLRYESLMNEWTTRTDATTNENGSLTFRGFHGTYEITLSVPGQGSELHEIELKPGQTPAKFEFETALEPQEPQNCADIIAFNLKLGSDLNYDCYVDELDLWVMADYWLDNDCAATENCEGADLLPVDGVVNFLDFNNFAGQWLLCNDPEDPDCP